MIFKSRLCRCWLAMSVPLVSAAFFCCPSAHSQDAFGWGPGGNWTTVIGVNESGSGGDSEQIGVDSFGSGPGPEEGTAPYLEGATNGTIYQSEEFGMRSQMPDGRLMLGQSLCDLSTQEVAADEEIPPPDFPPMPKKISILKEVSEQAQRRLAEHKNLLEEFESDEEPRPLGTQRSSVYAGKLTDAEIAADNARKARYARQYSVSRETLMRSQKVDTESANNPDFTARVAALSLKYRHDQNNQNAFERARELLNKKPGSPDQEVENLTKFKEAISAVKTSSATPMQRQKLAEKLEAQGKWYDALVERLRVVDMLDDGPSRFYLARVYQNIGEHKLAFETLRDAVSKDWSADEKPLLKECHLLMGESLFTSAREARKEGRADINMLRLRNASVSFRRAATMDPSDHRGANGLLKVAKEACAIDASFDNNLMLGGAYVLLGDLERAKMAYDECQAIAPDDVRLKHARLICQLREHTRSYVPQPETRVAAKLRKP